MEDKDMEKDLSEKEIEFEKKEEIPAAANDKKGEAEKESEQKNEKKADQKESKAASETEQEEQKVSVEDELKQQISAANDKYIRLMAEFDNYKKRTSREYERMVEAANEKLMVEMVDVRENFERALRSGESGADFNALFEGMKLIFSKFDGVLSRNGLEPFAAAGEPFDPQIHDALMKTPKQDIPEDHIADIYERGYKLKSKVIKHAKVIVSSGAPAAQDTTPKDNDNKDSK